MENSAQNEAVDLTCSYRYRRSTDHLGSGSPQMERHQDLTFGKWHAYFRGFEIAEDDDLIQCLDNIQKLCYLWIRPDINTKEQILDKIVLEKFMLSLPLHLQTLVRESGVNNCRDLRKVLENPMNYKTWTIVKVEEQEFLWRHSDVQMEDMSEEEHMDDESLVSRAPAASLREIKPQEIQMGQGHLPETISGNSELEAPTLEQGLEDGSMEDGMLDTPEPQLLNNRGEPVGVGDGTSPEGGPSVDFVEGDLERDVSVPSGKEKRSQKWKSSPRGRLVSSSSSQGRLQGGATVGGKRPFLGLVELLHPTKSTSTVAPTHCSSASTDAPEGPAPSQASGPEQGAPEPRDPGAPEARDPGAPEPRDPGAPEAGDPGAPDARDRGAPEARDPGAPEARDPGAPEARDPGAPEARDPGAPEAGDPGAPEPRERGAVYQCQFCPKRCNYKSQFEIHLRAHTGERPFKCRICEKGFMQPSDVRVHERIHTGEKPYKCEECSKKFTHESTLQGHRRTHTKERPFQCTECNKSFSHRGNLNVHLRIHTGLKPYTCCVCERQFRQLGTFKRHKKCHFKTDSP